MPAIYRSYKTEIVSRIEKLPFDVKQYGKVTYEWFSYPLFNIKTSSETQNAKHVLITGGVHGDEPAGIFAILDFLENHAIQYLDRFIFHAYPCLNPSGFEMNGRNTRCDIDINRSFDHKPKSLETKLFIESLHTNYLFAMDFHETDANPNTQVANEFFLWEVCEDKERRVGQKIIAAIEKKSPVCEWNPLYSDINNYGVINYPEGKGPDSPNLTLDQYLVRNHTDHSFTIETPQWMSIENRVDLHVTSIMTALDEYSKDEHSKSKLISM